MSTAASEPLKLPGETVPPEWIDYNGHMNVAYYVLAFDHATDRLLDRLELGEAYRNATDCSTFAAEHHVTYQREAMEGDPLAFEAYVLGCDDKRMHFMLVMLNGRTGEVAATLESLGLHVDLRERRVAPFSAEHRARLEDLVRAHADLPRPAEAGRGIALRKRSSG